MAGIKEIRSHIRSVESTLKITNAMYLISSSSLRKARQQLRDVQPYFSKLSYTIADILNHSPHMTHPYFDHRPKIAKEHHKVGYVVISGDKGLAGSYNHNVFKLAEQQLKATDSPTLFLVGQMGRTYFANRGIPVEKEFLYTSQNPTLTQARKMTEVLVPLFRNGTLDEISIIYTHMVNPLILEPKIIRLLPLDKDNFPWQPRCHEAFPRLVNYSPSEYAVLERLVPIFLSGMIFGSLVESFCAEQSARMTAMDASSKNARDMLRELNLSFNRARQSAITQEITEVVGGAQSAGD